ncbi:MAG: HEPN domain-containing protein [Thermomicrobiales bacterium]
MAGDTGVNIHLSKARASLAGAESELANGRFDNSVIRSYYACFQAAVAALTAAGFAPSPDTGRWKHDVVAARFNGHLIARRKRFSPEFRGMMDRLFLLRQKADYRETSVTQSQAIRAFRRARSFVDAITAEEHSP